MSDNVPMPRNYRRGRDKITETMERLVAELTEDFDGEEGPYHIGPLTQQAVRSLLESWRFYRVRCQKLHEAFPCIPSEDPTRQIIAEILANGYSTKAGQRP